MIQDLHIITDDIIKQYEEIQFLQSFDLERMREAIASPSYTPPEKLDREGLRKWILEIANNSDVENEKYISKR